MKNTNLLKSVSFLFFVICSTLQGWGANGDVLFTQAFGGSGSLTFTQNVAFTKASGLTGVVGDGANLFTSITTSNKNTTGIAINHATGGNSQNASGIFQAYFNNTSGYWSATRTSDFAATAPTAIKMTMDVWVNIISGSNDIAGVQFAIGDGFTDGLKSTDVQATSYVHSGFCITAESSPTLAQYNTPATDIYGTAISKSTWLSITWIINNTGSSITYDNPTGSGTTTLANDKFDIWLKTQAGAASTYTKVVSAQAATTGTIALQELHIGSNGGKKMEFRMDNLVVTDLTPAVACVAPSSVGVSGTWRCFPGQTISMTATPTGGTGTPSYQWQKEIAADNWSDLSNGTSDGVTISGATTNNLQITNCGTGNSGNYRCVVSTGATCSTTSDAFSVKIYSLNGAYDGDAFTSNNITYSSGTTGTATVHLAAGSVYKFKVTDNFGTWYGNTGRILEPAVDWTFSSNESENCVLFTGPEGDYTFTVDIDHVTYGTPEVVVSVGYPDVTHPAAGYAYFRNVDSWANVALYMWYEGGGEYAAWGSDPWVTRTTTICGNTYYYTPLIPSWYNRVIFHNAGGSGQTGDIAISNLSTYSGKYNDKSDASFHDFTTHTISFAANSGTGSMSSITGICPGSDQALTANSFTMTGYAFDYWTSTVNVKVGGVTVTAGSAITGGATLQDISADIPLSAHWKCNTPSISFDSETNTVTISAPIGATAYYTTDGTTPTSGSTAYSAPFTIDATKTIKTIAIRSGCTDSNVATETCTYVPPACFSMVADSEAAKDATLNSGESIAAESKNCLTLSGGTAVYRHEGGTMKVNKLGSGYYGWYFGSGSDSIVITLSGAQLQTGSIITIAGYTGDANGISINGVETVTNDAAGSLSGSYTVKNTDTDLEGKNVLCLKRNASNALRLFSITISGCAEFYTYDVTYKANGGSGSDVVHNVATVEGISDVSFTRAGYDFTGWKTGASSGTDYAVGDEVTSDLTLYAQWSCVTPTFGTNLSTSEQRVRQGASMPLTVAATANGTGGNGTVGYQWYSNTANSTTTPTPTLLSGKTSASYSPSTASLGTTYYFCVVTNTSSDCSTTATSNIAKIVVEEAPCFEFVAGTTKAGSGWDVTNNGSITTALWTAGQTLTGGTMTNTSGSSLGANTSYGLVYAADGNKQVTITLTGSHALAADAVITINGYSNNTKDACGFKISGNNMSPATYTPSSAAYTAFTQTYTVTGGSALDGSSSFTVDQATSIRCYIKSITVTGCQECETISPALTAGTTKLYTYPVATGTTLTLDKDGSTGDVEWSVSPSGVVSVSGSGTEVTVTAMAAGTATVTATIASDGDHCAKSVTKEFTVVGNCGVNVIAGVTRKSDSKTVMENPIGVLYGSSGVNSQTDGKLGSDGHYMYITLKSGEYLRDGDVVVINISAKNNGGIYLYAGTTSAGTQIGTIEAASITTGDNEITLSNVPDNTASVTMYRTGSNQNHKVDGIKVKRYTCPEHVFEYNNKNADGLWSTTANWVDQTGQGVAALPSTNDRVYIKQPVTVDIVSAQAKEVVLDQSSTNTGSLEINAGKELAVAQTVKVWDGSALHATTVNDIVINSTSSAGLGALVMGSHDGTNKATVNFTTRSKGIKDDNTSIAQYVGTPFNDETNILHNWYNSWVYGITYDGSNNIGWERVNEGQGMMPFRGYCVFSADGADHVYWEQGTLNASTTQTISDLNYQSDAGTANLNNENLLANSWMAPIYIKAMQSSDFVNADATVYIFNSTSASAYESGGFAGNYSSYTVNTAEAVIPAMQSFSVFTTGSGASVKLDYDKIVYQPALAGTAVPVPNKVISRERKSDDEANKLRLFVRTESGLGDILYMWEREDFSEAFENGWDGRKMYGESYAPQLYAITTDGAMAVNCVPTYEGVLIGFRAGTDEQTYTFSFEYDANAEPLYLYDKYADAYTRVLSGNTYQFVANDYDAHARFSLTHYMPGVATGMDAVSGQQSAVRCQKILLNERILILRDGKLYDVTGKTVK